MTTPTYPKSTEEPAARPEPEGAKSVSVPDQDFDEINANVKAASGKIPRRLRKQLLDIELQLQDLDSEIRNKQFIVPRQYLTTRNTFYAAVLLVLITGIVLIALAYLDSNARLTLGVVAFLAVSVAFSSV